MKNRHGDIVKSDKNNKSRIISVISKTRQVWRKEVTAARRHQKYQVKNRCLGKIRHEKWRSSIIVATQAGIIEGGVRASKKSAKNQ